MTQSQNLEENSLFRIMVATDNHLGYLEHDQIRGDDSFVSFEEILKVSKNENVDFLLLGGDLFHHHNPSKKTIIRASNILQKHIYGQKEHNFEVYCYQPNFKNENLSIELPIFIIHGNHDDPSGFDNFSSIDIFSNREVNYFGKINNYEEFDLYPILFVKGNTKVALYGIGNIKDERLYLALQNKKVNFHRPEDYKNWFNILIVHQNRFKGHNVGKNKKNYLPESFIPSFFDLVIWGHEHETFTEPVFNNEVGLHVYQPGSSVVTSLIQAESKPKCVGLLEINLDKFRIVPIKLQTVRPFVYQQLELKSYAYRLNSEEDAEKLIEEKIEEMLQDAEKEASQGDGMMIGDSVRKNLPILRLKIEFTGYQITRTNFIISKFAGKIANPGDVIQFFKKGDVFRIKNKQHVNDCEMEIEPCDYVFNLEDEIQYQDGDLKQFISENISTYLVEKNKKSYFNTDFFCEALEKSVNGQEKRSLELLFKTFCDNSFNLVKFDQHSSFLLDLNAFDNVKKGFSHVTGEILDQNEINNLIMNNIKNNKRNSARSSVTKDNEGLNLNNNNISNNFSNNFNSISSINPNVSNNSNRNNNVPQIKLTKTNDFQNEKRENKSQMFIDLDNCERENISQNPSRHVTNLSSNIQKKPQTRSILDYIDKKSSRNSESFESQKDSKDEFKIMIEGAGMERIEEVSEEMFANKKRNFDNVNNNFSNINVSNSNSNLNTNTNNQAKLKKKKNFMIEDKKNANKRNTKLK